MNRYANDLKIIALGIEEIIKSSKLKTFAKEECIDFNRILYHLSKKYLSFYSDNQTKYDIMMGMFLSVYNVKWNNLQKNYDNSYTLRNYLFTAMKNEIISISKKYTRKSSKISGINPIEDESEEDSWNRVTMGGESVSSARRGLSSDEKEIYDSLINDYEVLKLRIIKRDLKVQDLEESLSNIDRKIEKIKTEMQVIDGYHREKYIDNSSLIYQSDHQEQLDDVLSDIIERLKTKLRNMETSYRGHKHRPWQGDRIKFIDLILADFNYSECAIFFEVTPTSTNKWSKQIQTALLELADELEFDHSDDSFVEKINEWLDSLEKDDRVNRSQQEGCPKPKDRAELYRQIVSTFGVEFMQLSDEV